ncbi:unnamed protein product [Candidula unifasciata]|uniref:D-isomer specific 2-hydroxyacid dehydrogenase NAD-binding domain-containing protein n=1 Tax=Candidula unifasciata TaxID=100452 RepID=A0A8S3YWH3_9EUPU|nr:unnamed protein product [Candidula unifasciata]
MAARSISRVHVISTSAGLADEIQSLLTKAGLSIEVKEISLQKYGAPVFEKTVLRKLTSAALEDVRVEEIEYLIAFCPTIAEVLSRPNNQLKWAQSTSAGVDVFFSDYNSLKISPDFIMSRTTGSGRGQMMAEYVLVHILARERNLNLLAEQQKQARFDNQHLAHYRMLSDLSIGILGLGSIGREVARACKAMNMVVWAGVRDKRLASGETVSPDVDYYRPMSRLNELLQECDYLACILPATPETKSLLSGDVLEPCKQKKTVLINTGRGNLIDDDSLINAVNQGWLGGAILDVFNQEPLPSHSPLWTLPGVTITPHVSCLARNNASMIAKSYVNNLVRYLNGEQLLNQVDFTKGY